MAAFKAQRFSVHLSKVPTQTDNPGQSKWRLGHDALLNLRIQEEDQACAAGQIPRTIIILSSGFDGISLKRKASGNQLCQTTHGRDAWQGSDGWARDPHYTHDTRRPTEPLVVPTGPGQLVAEGLVMPFQTLDFIVCGVVKSCGLDATTKVVTHLAYVSIRNKNPAPTPNQTVELQAIQALRRDVSQQISALANEVCTLRSNATVSQSRTPRV